MCIHAINVCDTDTSTLTPSWHIVGYLVASRNGKVSSALLSVLPDTEEVTTKTGKIYLLENLLHFEFHQ